MYFVSDNLMTSDKFRGSFTGLSLPREVVDKIYYENAVKWFNLISETGISRGRL
jgi:hypothetical protein